MGCGQSRLSLSSLKRRKKKNQSGSSNNSKENEQQEIFSEYKKKTSSDIYVNRSSFLGEDINKAKKRIANKIRPISGPLQPPLNTSTSQVDFFKMLDEKIDSGRDYYSEPEDDNMSRSRTSSASKMFRNRKDSKSSYHKLSAADTNNRLVTLRLKTNT